MNACIEEYSFNIGDKNPPITWEITWIITQTTQTTTKITA